MLNIVIMLVIGAATAALVTPLMQLLKKVSGFVNGLPDILKQALVGGLAFAVAKLYAVLGLPAPADFLGMDPTTAQTLIGTVLAWLAHHLFVSTAPAVVPVAPAPVAAAKKK